MRLVPSTGLLLVGLLLGGCASQWKDMFVSYSDQMVPLRASPIEERLTFSPFPQILG